MSIAELRAAACLELRRILPLPAPAGPVGVGPGDTQPPDSGDRTVAGTTVTTSLQALEIISLTVRRNVSRDALKFLSAGRSI